MSPGTMTMPRAAVLDLLGAAEVPILAKEIDALEPVPTRDVALVATC